MRRRTLLAAAGLAAPAQFLIGVDVALAGVPDPSGSAAPLDQRLARARGLFDAGQHARLLEALPGLLGDAHVAARSRQELALARLSTTYSLLSQVLTKIGRYQQSRQAADRATVYADLSGSPLAAAAAAREMSIVLRHQDQPAAAQRLILKAAAQSKAPDSPTARRPPRTPRCSAPRRTARPAQETEVRPWPRSAKPSALAASCPHRPRASACFR
ncbi:hypothetical protein [Streptomyces sp. NPDC017529]|uniref:hypothetical protein n=1 Tax=Streptomyces sp. NPDC017529 TaxID=3365000 RepID=UPI00378CBDE4